MRESIGEIEYEGSLSFTLDSDEDIEAFAKMTGQPVLYVSDDVWDDKPFIVTDTIEFEK